MKQKRFTGFTLIELLVVIAIIGILAVVVLINLSSARVKSRDARRVSDLDQVSKALELYYNDCGGYPPVSSPGLVLGAAGQKLYSGSDATCSDGGFGTSAAGTVYMDQTPANPTPGGADYKYVSEDPTTFSITFTLEGQVDRYSGSLTRTPSGIQ